MVKINNRILICWGRSGMLCSSFQDIQLPVSYTSFYRATSSGSCWEENGYCLLNWCICGYKDLSTVHCATRYIQNAQTDYVQYITIGI